MEMQVAEAEKRAEKIRSHDAAAGGRGPTRVGGEGSEACGVRRGEAPNGDLGDGALGRLANESMLMEAVLHLNARPQVLLDLR